MIGQSRGITSLSPTTRAVLALCTNGVLGGEVDHAKRQPLEADEALRVIEVLALAGVPPQPHGEGEEWWPRLPVPRRQGGQREVDA